MGGLYTARTEDGLEYVLRAKKKFRRQRVTPLVGDRVLFTPGEISDEHGWVEEILPRANQFVRPPVANVTLLCVTISPVPEPDCLLVDKLLVFAQMQDLTAVLVVNKNDLDGGETAARLAAAYERTAAGGKRLLFRPVRRGQVIPSQRAFLRAGADGGDQ